MYFGGLLWVLPTLAKEAREVMEDGAGRWFSFALTASSVIVLEKKGVADHLQSLPCIDSPTELSTVIRELEDAGEVLQGSLQSNIDHQKYENNLFPEITVYREIQLVIYFTMHLGETLSTMSAGEVGCDPPFHVDLR